MSLKNYKNYNKLKNILLINCIILISKIKIISSTGTIRQEYNFGRQQDPAIDKSFNHVLGRNVYFVTEPPEKSMYITAIYPSLTLQVKLKIYTDNSRLINAFNSGKKIFFGFDLLIENMDITENYYENYSTDIMICIFDKKDVDCHDYVFNNNLKQYEINDNGSVLKNNLIPLGFTNIDLNYIQENVIGYKNYFSVKFEKEYPPLFDNITMFNWINYVASDTGDGIYGFYGIVADGDDLSVIPFTSNLYIEKHDFVDGFGLDSATNLSFYKKYLFIFILIFLTIN